jgi:phosphate transport system substrate-binding protein
VLVALLALVALQGGMATAQPAAAALPAYQGPAAPQAGVLRIFGAELKGLVRQWEEEYRKRNPTVSIADSPGGSDAAIGVLQQGTADIAVFGRELELSEYLGFFEVKGYNPTEFTIASGTYDTPGATWAPLIFVNQDNPLTQLTMKQLDGIFGSERTGGYEGFLWKTENARPAKDNIRTWGQLGLKGAWAKQQIQTYGYADGGMAHFFEIQVLRGSNKWNPNYRQYVENGTKILTAGRESGGILSMLAELEHDKYGIGWAGMPQWKEVPLVKGIKVLALAARDGGPFIVPGRDTLASRAYPLTRSVYIYLDKEPGRPLSPIIKDFLRYVLSAEGQEQVRANGVYFPLPAALVREQLRNLE